MPNYDTPITVASLTELMDVHVAELDEGTLAWVSSEDTVYVLHKTLGLAASPPAIVVPNPGSPIAGAAGAGWTPLVPSGGGVLQSLLAQLVPDVSATNGAPAVASMMFSVPQDGAMVLLTGSFSGAADRGATALLELLVDGVPIVGANIVSAAAQDIAGAVTARSAALTAGNHTIGVRLTPQGGLVVAINATTEPTTDHLRATGLLVTV